jgi:hypothetical protein
VKAHPPAGRWPTEGRHPVLRCPERGPNRGDLRRIGPDPILLSNEDGAQRVDLDPPVLDELDEKSHSLVEIFLKTPEHTRVIYDTPGAVNPDAPAAQLCAVRGRAHLPHAPAWGPLQERMDGLAPVNAEWVPGRRARNPLEGGANGRAGSTPTLRTSSTAKCAADRGRPSKRSVSRPIRGERPRPARVLPARAARRLGPPGIPRTPGSTARSRTGEAGSIRSDGRS